MPHTVASPLRNLRVALANEMHRVDAMRMKLNMAESENHLIEFLLRRDLIRAHSALQRGDTNDLIRMWSLLKQRGI
jgi:hypothetical protein